MSALVFILRPEGGEDGPYREEEVLDALEAGDLRPEDWCRLEGQAEPRRLGAVFERMTVEEEDGPWDDDRDEDGEDDDSEDDDSEDEGDEEDDEEDGDEEDGESPGEALSWDLVEEGDGGDDAVDGEGGYDDEGDEADEVVVYDGSPSVLGYGGALVVAAVILGVGYRLGRFGAWWVMGALAVSLVLVGRMLVHRAAREYLVTTERVVATVGLMAKRTREIPLRELTSIRVLYPSLLGWLGVGTVIFSRGAGPGQEVVFERIGRVRKVIALVRDGCRR
jgi:hypothetical protein